MSACLMTHDQLINPVLPFTCVPTDSMDNNTSKKKWNVNVWFLFHMTVVEDVIPEKDNFPIFSLTDCEREFGTSAPIFLLSLPTVIPVTLLETFVDS